MGAYACFDGKERIMSQNQQYKKVKLFRVLKVVFYMLGLPLFLFAVFCSAVKFIGHDPFVGTSEFANQLGFFYSFEELITSPALYGIWIAFAIWAFISIVHIILSKVVKNRRSRMVAMLAICLVVMLGSAFCMDAVFESKITQMQNDAPAGVTVEDYKTQLSYYRALSSAKDGNDYTSNVINQIELLQKVYNVEMQGVNKSGVAGNISNKPITYYNIIDDNGEVGVDISFAVGEDGLYRLNVDGANNIVGDGEITQEIEGKQVVRLAPNGNGELVINGKVYSHYFAKEQIFKDGSSRYVWYTKDMMPLGTEFGDAVTVNIQDGVYGEAIYNQTGLLSDGWVFSLDNVLKILADYYKGKAIVEKYDADGILGKDIHEMGVEMREEYYNGSAIGDGIQLDEANAAWMIALFNQEVQMTERFSLTRGDIDLLISKVGGLLGKNSLFDFLLKPNDTGDTGLDDVLGQAGLGSVADLIKPILTQLQNGMSLAGVVNNDATMATIIDIVKAIVGYTGEIKDLYIVLAYDGATDGMGVERNNLYLAIVKDNGAGAIGTDKRHVNDGGDVLIDIDFSAGIIDEETGDYAFDLDHLSEFLNKTINGLLSHFNIDLKEILVDNTIGKLLGGLLIKDIEVNGTTYKGLVISGISIPLFDENYNAQIDITSILQNLLSGLYSYQSAVFKPAWEFYELIDSMDDEFVLVAKGYAMMERAEYEASTHGALIGSVLLGDTLGAGTYSSSFGLADLQSVQQVQADLAYKPEFYPLFALRDCLMFFTGIVILFYFLSFVAAEREIEYATGKKLPKEKKAKKQGKKNKGADDAEVKDGTTESADVKEVGEENKDVNADDKLDGKKDEKQQHNGDALPVKQNNDKEVR